ncbi:MAG TPA: Pre-mRNA processing ribonucleoprotein [Methanothermococcus okinawensis]|uniref:Pre-mRNA processing ribonucleoprotein n=1 Tax=Methanothermococcus okinawensis TaxID=155863 RepID=A0A832YT26_9EURY|nr:Pre-mRNA processing ribonucleoprotein [Methanothermococcus okinawensis]
MDFKRYLIFTHYGAFLFEYGGDSKNLTIDSIKHYKIFNEDEIPKIMCDLRNGNFEIIESLKKEWNLNDNNENECKRNHINNNSKNITVEEIIVEYLEDKPTVPGNFVRENIYNIGKKYGVFENYEDFIEKLNLWTTEFTKLLMKESSEKKDKLIIQTVSALDDLDETLNLFSERLREWYSLYFPEMDKLIKKHDLYVDLISEYFNRENYTRTRLKKTLPSKLARTLSTAAKNSMGAELSERDLSTIKLFAEEVKSMYLLRKKLQDYLEELMKEIAPNLTKLAGPSLGARLISLTGGIDRLSKLPASTIQVLGAEKALFAHLREGAQPPKHGVIFQHPFIQSSPWWIRGKVARALACKLSIGIRADVFGNYIAEELMESLSKKVESIKEKNPEPKRKKSVNRDRKKTGNVRGKRKNREEKEKKEEKGKKEKKGKNIPRKGKTKNKKDNKKNNMNNKIKNKDNISKKKKGRKIIGKTSSKF